MRNAKGQFVKGHHWRTHKPYWDAKWLSAEYGDKTRSAAEIASQFGLHENAILYWLTKLGIKKRTMTEIRKAKRWGCSGADNPMFGKSGRLNPNWRGGLTPARQAIYSTREWKVACRAVRKRDRACRLCAGARDTEVHHIERFAEAPLLVFDVNNMILLCNDCHKKLRGKERKWRKRLYNLLS